MATEATRERLLDAAETLYARHGIDATSLRAITAEAGANLAAVHYHFGSKDALTREVLARRIRPLTRERLTRLDRLEATGEPALDELLRAFLAPALALFGSAEGAGSAFARLVGRVHSEPDESLQDLVFEQFEETAMRFTRAFSAALPGLDAATLFWRLNFMIGSMAHTLASPAMIARVSEGACDPTDMDQVLEQLVAFLVGGMTAGTHA